MNNKPQLFCFTYAGGTASFFDLIEKDLIGIDVVKIEYAGHGERHNEKFYPSFDELRDDLYIRLKNQIIGDYSLFGYSMGSISAIEVLKKILDSDMPRPKHMFLAAHEPHTKCELLGFNPEELDYWVKDRTIRFGDVPEKLMNNKVFWRTYLPIYKSDYTIIAKYDFEKLDLKSDIPTTIFYSETDTPLSDMRQWEKYFTGAIEYKTYEGNHFFIRKHHEEIAEVIKKRIGEKE